MKTRINLPNATFKADRNFRSSCGTRREYSCTLGVNKQICILSRLNVAYGYSSSFPVGSDTAPVVHGALRLNNIRLIISPLARTINGLLTYILTQRRIALSALGRLPPETRPTFRRNAPYLVLDGVRVFRLRFRSAGLFWDFFVFWTCEAVRASLGCSHNDD